MPEKQLVMMCGVNLISRKGYSKGHYLKMKFAKCLFKYIFCKRNCIFDVVLVGVTTVIESRKKKKTKRFRGMDPVYCRNNFGYKTRETYSTRMNEGYSSMGVATLPPVPIEQPYQLEVDWEKIDEHFSTRFQIVYACTTTKIHLDVSNISVDGAKNKVGSI